MLFWLLIYFYRRDIDWVSLIVLQISYIARWQFMTWLVQCWLCIWQRMLPNIKQYFSAKKSQGLSSSFQYSQKTFTALIENDDKSFLLRRTWLTHKSVPLYFRWKDAIIKKSFVIKIQTDVQNVITCCFHQNSSRH